MDLELPRLKQTVVSMDHKYSELKKKWEWIQKLSNEELLTALRTKVAQEREILEEVLLLIKELDARSLHLEKGFPSLFDFLTREIGYSEGSAQRRIDAVRLIRELPEALIKINTGELKLSQISQLQRSARESQKIHGMKITTETKKLLIQKIVGKNAKESEYSISSTLQLPIKDFEKQKIQSNQSIRIEFTLSKEAIKEVRRAQHLLSHSLKDSQISTFLMFVARKIIRQKAIPHRKRKNIENKDKEESMNLSTEEHQLLNNPESDLNTEHISMQEYEGEISDRVRKLMIALYKHCQYKDPQTGRICGSQWQLQVDHIQPLWAGGANKLDNYRLLCSRHNLAKYKKEANIKKVESPPF